MKSLARCSSGFESPSIRQKSRTGHNTLAMASRIPLFTFSVSPKSSAFTISCFMESSRPSQFLDSGQRLLFGSALTIFFGLRAPRDHEMRRQPNPTNPKKRANLSDRGHGTPSLNASKECSVQSSFLRQRPNQRARTKQLAGRIDSRTQPSKH